MSTVEVMNAASGYCPQSFFEAAFRPSVFRSMRMMRVHPAFAKAVATAKPMPGFLVSVLRMFNRSNAMWIESWRLHTWCCTCHQSHAWKVCNWRHCAEFCRRIKHRWDENQFIWDLLGEWFNAGLIPCPWDRIYPAAGGMTRLLDHHPKAKATVTFFTKPAFLEIQL